jgi:hypothetical protein
VTPIADIDQSRTAGEDHMQQTTGTDAVLTAMAGHGLLPPDALAVYLTGSRVRGWGNRASDVDVVVVSPDSWSPPDGGGNPVGWGAARIRHVKTAIDGQPYDVEYWTEEQVTGLLGKVSWQAYEPGRGLERQFMLYEVNFLDRLANAVSVAGHEAVEEWRQAVRDSAFKAMRAAFWRHDAVNYCSAAQGQLASGDVHSATLSARLAFEHAVDALLARHGQLSSNAKWRARRFKSVNPPSLDFDRYWTTQTMQEYQTLGPAGWVTSTVATATALCEEVGEWLAGEHARRAPAGGSRPR